jgi:hypothetical protein
MNARPKTAAPNGLSMGGKNRFRRLSDFNLFLFILACDYELAG